MDLNSCSKNFFRNIVPLPGALANVNHLVSEDLGRWKLKLKNMRQMAIKNTVSSDFRATFVDCMGRSFQDYSWIQDFETDFP